MQESPLDYCYSWRHKFCQNTLQDGRRLKKNTLENSFQMVCHSALSFACLKTCALLLSSVLGDGITEANCPAAFASAESKRKEVLPHNLGPLAAVVSLHLLALAIAGTGALRLQQCCKLGWRAAALLLLPLPGS